jgi:hypothetical protein
VHREGALLCAFEGSRARVSSLARDGTAVTVGEMDAGARVADAAWRERAPTRDEREEDWHRTRAWCRSEERARVCASEETIGTSLAMVTEGGEVSGGWGVGPLAVPARARARRGDGARTVRD